MYYMLLKYNSINENKFVECYLDYINSKENYMKIPLLFSEVRLAG